MNKINLLIATTNEGKVREIKKLLRGLGLHLESLKSYPHFGKYQETGRTFAENSEGKSLYYSQRYPGLVLAEDSGLEVEALGGKPGVYSARFSGVKANDKKNINKLLNLMTKVPVEKRKARFVCVATLTKGGKVIKSYRGTVSGMISLSPEGDNGFGYDPVFYYPPLKKTFARLKPSEKNRVSHRARAFRKIREFLKHSLKHQANKKARPGKSSDLHKG
ncbi:MAG: XTP/dITP diphosphatase [Candidatus Saccharicenans sp.]